MQKYEDLFMPSFLNHEHNYKHYEHNKDCDECDNNICGIDKNKGTPPSFPKNWTLAMAYIPFQQNIDAYEPETALKNGTLFEQLDKPFSKGRMVKK